MPSSLQREGVHRLQRGVDIDAGEIFGLDDLGSLLHRGGGVAVLDEEETLSPLFLQAARLIDDRLIGHLGVWAFVPIDLQRRRGLLGAFVVDRYCDHPARSRAGLVLDHDGLDEARNLLGLAIVDRFHRRAIAHRRNRELAVEHSRHEGVDAVLAGAVGLRRNVELRQRLADLRALVRRFQRDRLELVGRPGLVRLAAFDDFGKGDALLDFAWMTRDSLARQFVLRHAHHLGAGLDERKAPGSAGAAHRVEIHPRAPAAAGQLGAKDRIIVFRIVRGEDDGHVLPGCLKLLGDELRHGAGDVLAHFGFADRSPRPCRHCRSHTMLSGSKLAAALRPANPLISGKAA